MMTQLPWVFRSLWIVCVWVVLGLGMVPDSLAGGDTIAREARETVEAAKEYTAHQKDAFQRKAQEELSAIQSQIETLRGKARNVSASTRAELQKSIDELDKKKEGVKDRLDALRDATDAKWHTIKTAVDTAFDEMKGSYQKALSRVP
jgi:ABC-type phosphate transport system auxiliary subunit